MKDTPIVHVIDFHNSSILLIVIFCIQVEKSRVFVKNVTEVFGKPDGGRFKCPRCKGNGLNSSHQFWDRNQSFDSSESCWFCEGYVSAVYLFSTSSDDRLEFKKLVQPVDSP